MRHESDQAELGKTLHEQEAWLRRLVRGLGQAGSDVDDLTQDVLVAALRDAPRGRGPALHAWLRTTAQRLVARAGRTERERAQRERRAARPEAHEPASDSDAAARLEAQRRLLVAVEDLDAQFRTAIVLRYMDGLSPREIAARLDISPDAARQRVARGLAKLRARLAPELRERKDMLAAFVGLAQSHAPRIPAAASIPDVGVALTAWTVLVKKPLALLALATLLVVGWVVVSPFSEEQRGADVAAALDARDPAASAHGLEDELLAATSATRTDGSDVGATAVPSSTRTPLLRVLDPDGVAAQKARAAWVDRFGEVHVLELAPDGTAPIPAGSAQAPVFAKADGLALATAELAETGEDVVVTLHRYAELRDRVTVDGAVPSEPVLMTLHPDDPMLWTNGPWRERVKEALLALGFGEPRIEALTDAGGVAIFPKVHPEGKGVVHPQGSYSLRVGDAQYGCEVGRGMEIAQDLIRQPCVTGRVLWADTQEPVTGQMMVVFHNQESGYGPLGDVAADGRFEVQLTSETTGGGNWRSRVTLKCRITDEPAAALGFEYTLSSDDLPFDVGTLQLVRAELLSVRVVTSDGRPVHRAQICCADWPEVAVATNAAGHAKIIPPSDGCIHVLAEGHAVGTFRVANAERHPDGVLLLPLEPGRTLRVSLQHFQIPEGRKAPNLVLRWEQDPFESFRADGDLEREDRTRSGALIRCHGESWKELFGRGRNEYLELEWQGELPLVIPGLRAGAQLVVGLKSVVETELAHAQEVEVPTEAGVFDLALELPPGSTRRLQLEAVDVSGAPIAGARFDAKRPGDEYLSSIEEDPWPLPHGPLVVHARASGYVARQVELAADAGPVLSIQLQRARSITVRTVDEGGRSMRPERVLATLGGERFGASPGKEVATLIGVAQAPGEVEVMLGGRVWRAPIDATTSEVTVHVPVHGTLRVSLASPPPITSRKGEWAVFVSIPGADALEGSHVYSAGAEGPTAVELALLPGKYAMEVRMRAHDEEGLWRVLHTADVEVAAEAVTQLDL